MRHLSEHASARGIVATSLNIDGDPAMLPDAYKSPRWLKEQQGCTPEEAAQRWQLCACRLPLRNTTLNGNRRTHARKRHANSRRSRTGSKRRRSLACSPEEASPLEAPHRPPKVLKRSRKPPGTHSQRTARERAQEDREGQTRNARRGARQQSQRSQRARSCRKEDQAVGSDGQAMSDDPFELRPGAHRRLARA